MRKTAAIHNLGCKVNSYEAARMSQALKEAGFTLLEFGEKADIYIINTCTVTSIADKKSRQLLHRARELNPHALIVAAGCYVETGKQAMEQAGIADLYVRNEEKDRIVSLIEKALGDMPPESGAEASAKASPAAVPPPKKVRAFLKVQDGCERFCSYCIIPHARGPVRIRPEEEALSEAREMAAGGYAEIVVTGIHVSSMGEERLLSLLSGLNALPGLTRVRLSSLEPGIITPGFVKGISSLNSLCPHFHLSLQSGCDATLRRMNRHYTAAQYREAVRLIRETFPHPAITTDVIAGFPGETDGEFEESLGFCREMRFFQIHIFPYSQRRGTMAAGMPHQVESGRKKERCGRLKALREEHELSYLQGLLRQEVQLLVEEKKRISGKDYYLGHTKEYAPAAIEVPQEGFPELSPGELITRRPRGLWEEKKTLLL